MSFLHKIPAIIFLMACLGAIPSANAGLVFSTASPSTNSTDWATGISSAGGGPINSNVNFDAHPLGALQTGFYSVSDGVTISITGSASVLNNAGPGQTTVGGAIPGEGVHPASAFLQHGDLAGGGVLTISFDTGVLGAGLFTIDKFTSSILSYTAFTGQNGTGSVIGTQANISSANFQTNNLFFIGARTDDSTMIGSIQIGFNTGGNGDVIGYDNIVFARLAAIPEPSSAALVSFVLLGTSTLRRRRSPCK